MDNFYIDVHTDQKNDKVVCWYRDNNHKLQVHEEPLHEHLYCFVPDNTGNATHKSIYGDPLKRVNFESRSELRSFADRHDSVCFSDVAAEYKFMLTQFNDCPVEQPINMVLFDIEVDFDLASGTGYPSPNDPFGEINSIQFYDTSKQKYYVLIPNHLEGQIHLDDPELPVKIIYTYSEADMLDVFAQLIQDTDVISGWNSEGFDLPYLIERARIRFGDRKGLSMFCRSDYPARRRDFVNAFGEETFSYKLIGRSEADMLLLYKKFNPGEKPSFSLQSIVELELGESKVDYDGDLGELYRSNPQKFYEYAIHDARLLKKLEDKLKIIQLGVTLSRTARVKISDVTGSVKVSEGMIAKFCLAHNIVLPDRSNPPDMEYPGAIVYDTVKGRHTNVFTIDLNSLYPSVMKMLGCSRENMIIECLGNYDDYVSIVTRTQDPIQIKIITTNETETIYACDLMDIIVENGYTIAANGVIFDGTVGILARVVDEFLVNRAAARKRKAACECVGDAAGAQREEMNQLVFKVAANALYGVSGNKTFKLYDVRVSAAITTTAQVISKWQAYKADSLIEEVFNGCR